MKNMKFMLVLSLATLMLVLFMLGCQEKGETELTDKEIKEVASDHLNIPFAQLELLGRSKATFRWIDQQLTTAKLIDIRDEKGFDIAIDNSKQVVDKAELIKTNQESFQERYGKLEPALFDSLAMVPKDHLFKVAIWLQTEPKLADSTDRPTATGNFRDALSKRKRLYDASRAENKKLCQNFVNFLSRQNITPQYTAQSAPLVFLQANAAVIRAIQDRDDVEFIYIARVGEDLNNTAIPTVAGSAWPPAGFEGSGVRVAIVEDDGIDFSNPFLAPAFGGRFQPDATNLGHPTQVAGVVASGHVVYRGMAPEATLLSANGGTYDAADIIAATDWAVGTEDADVINCSFAYGTSDGDHDVIARYFDHVVWNDWRSVVPAAGNSGGAMGAPADAYNVLTVGGIDDVDTPWHNDDTIYGSTSWQDPTSSYHDDREKPEVAAVATRYLTTEDASYGQWITAAGGGHNGTSYAAPEVSGAIARLINRKWFLFTWPEEVKAIIMASASRRVFDATVDTDNSTVDVKEGVGTIVVPLAEKIVGQNWHDGAYLTSASFPYNYYFYAEKDDIVRFVICWDAHTDVVYTTVSLEADLDLHVYEPGGTRVAYSISWDNPYEIVEFTAPANGTYRAWIRDWRFDATYEWLGLAYSRR